MMKPNFMILGAAKCGTTSLYHYLRQHPQVYMSEPKEPRFFEMEYAKGMDFYWHTYFGGWAGEPAIGEASPRNLFLPYVPPRIKRELPGAKLIAMFRNPVDRAFSAWWMRYSLGVEKLTFREAVQANLEQIASGFTFAGEDGERLWREAIHWGGTRPHVKYRWYLDMGYYALQLRRYLELFPDTQFKVLFFHDLRKAPHPVIQEVWDFVGVDPDFPLADTTPQMVGIPKAGLPLLRMAQATGTQRLIPKRLRTWVAMVLSKHSHRPTIEPSMRDWLVAHYAQHNRDLERIVGRDLSFWDR
jgi:hypothetical protein